VTGLCNRLHRLLTSRRVFHGVMFGNRPNRRTSVSICVSVVKTCDTYLSGLTPCQQDAQLGSGLRIRSSEGAILPPLHDATPLRCTSDLSSHLLLHLREVSPPKFCMYFQTNLYVCLITARISFPDDDNWRPAGNHLALMQPPF
jgi:hypothetical protein